MKWPLKFRRDYRKSEELKDVILAEEYEISEKVSETRPTIHLTDLVYCPLKPFNRLILKTKPKPLGKTLMYWLIGRIFHKIIQEKFDLTETEIKLGEVVAHIDVLHNNEPIEIKTTRMFIFHASHLPETYQKQIAYEMLFTGSKRGWLFVLDIVRAIPFVWKVSTTKTGLIKIMNQFSQDLINLKLGFQKKDPNLFEPVRWQCESCPYNYVPNGCPRSPFLDLEV